ncbi:MAG: hypothetical protein WB611_09710 [Stellaceae bacterium]
MDHNEYAASLGKIVGNFHALELCLRLFLCEARNEKYALPGAGATMVALSHLTNFDSLGRLIEKYNASLLPTENRYRIDPKIVRIRDALAHGRSVSATGSFPITLYKFSKAKVAGMVSVEFAEVLDEMWLNEAAGNIFIFVQKVTVCAKSRSYTWMD